MQIKQQIENHHCTHCISRRLSYMNGNWIWAICSGLMEKVLYQEILQLSFVK